MAGQVSVEWDVKPFVYSPMNGIYGSYVDLPLAL